MKRYNEKVIKDIISVLKEDKAVFRNKMIQTEKKSDKNFINRYKRELLLDFINNYDIMIGSDIMENV